MKKIYIHKDGFQLNVKRGNKTYTFMFDKDGNELNNGKCMGISVERKIKPMVVRIQNAIR